MQKALTGKGILTCLLFMLITSLMLLVLSPFNATAAPAGVELSTRYPGVTATPGENLTFPLEISSGGRAQAVKLSITQKPDGWTTAIKGNGRLVHEVFAGNDSPATADLTVKVPVDATPGEYAIVLSAAGLAGGADSLRINILVSKEGSGADKLVTQYSELKGPSTATFTFRVDLTNNSAEEQLFSLGAAAPEGWQVAISPAYNDQQIASLSVKPGETAGLDIKVTPPAQVEAGEYNIPVQAVSGSGMAATDLKVIITGTYNLEFTTPSGRLNADLIAGREKKVTMELRNKGSAALNDINFTSNEPSGWSVSFDPQTIDILKPGENRRVTAVIKADNNAIAGDYLVTLGAGTRETRGEAEMRVTVKTSTWWGIAGLSIILAVIAGVYAAFRYYGRR